MRIIGGTHRGRRIETVEAPGMRPVRDAVREALFSILGERIEGARVLDLYAGSGSLGLEALSRGAERAVFVERDEGVAAQLRRNVEGLGFSARARIATVDALAFLGDVAGGKRPGGYAVAFADPPFAFSSTPGFSDLVRGLSQGALWGAGEATAVVEVEARGAREADLDRLPGEVAYRRYGRNLLAISKFHSRA